jgi:molecular chaperone GrpE
MKIPTKGHFIKLIFINMQDQNEDTNEEEIIESPYDNADDIEYDASESMTDVVKKLKEKIKLIQKEKDEYLTNWQRERADFVNFKKDEDVRMTRSRNMVKESMLESLLPILDSFSVVFMNKEVWEKVDENWRRGIEYIHQQFNQVLADNGISEISPNYIDEFDPTIHQSIEDRITDKEEEKGKIITTIQKGYKIGESVIRPARVVTGK